MSTRSLAACLVSTLAVSLLGLGCLLRPASTPVEITNSMDGSQMVYVELGPFKRGSDNGPDPERPQRALTLHGFYMDKYEVTNEQYRRFTAATGRPEPQGYGFAGSRRVADFKPWRDPRFDKPNQPVVCVSWEDATAYAAWAGKRLPTEAEWEKAARGLEGRMFPWGNLSPYRGDMYVANYDPSSTIPNATTASDGFEFTAPVGSYEPGKSPFGAYDMAGNAAEWCADWYDPNYYFQSPAHDPQGPAQGKYRALRGGSWGSIEGDIRCAARSGGSPDFRHWYIGFRCAKDAPGEEQSPGSLKKPGFSEAPPSAPQEPPKPSPQAIVMPPAPSTSGELPIEKISARDGATGVLIPAGEFAMGRADGDNDEKPVRNIFLPSYYMDKYPVTNAQYKKFVEATGRPEPMGYGFRGGRFVEDFRPWEDPRFNPPQMPVVCVSCLDAAEYARWAGRRLPTEAEWEKAAKGLFATKYPWGNTDPTPNKARYGLEMEKGSPSIIGTHPAGATSYGCMDMAGSVWQWCSDWYSETTYQFGPLTTPTGPPTGEAKVLRGGSWANGGALLRCSARFCYPPTKKTFYAGFRCVEDVMAK